MLYPFSDDACSSESAFSSSSFFGNDQADDDTPWLDGRFERGETEQGAGLSSDDTGSLGCAFSPFSPLNEDEADNTSCLEQEIPAENAQSSDVSSQTPSEERQSPPQQSRVLPVDERRRHCRRATAKTKKDKSGRKIIVKGRYKGTVYYCRECKEKLSEVNNSHNGHKKSVIWICPFCPRAIGYGYRCKHLKKHMNEWGKYIQILEKEP